MGAIRDIFDEARNAAGDAHDVLRQDVADATQYAGNQARRAVRWYEDTQRILSYVVFVLSLVPFAFIGIALWKESIGTLTFGFILSILIGYFLVNRHIATISIIEKVFRGSLFAKDFYEYLIYMTGVCFMFVQGYIVYKLDYLNATPNAWPTNIEKYPVWVIAGLLCLPLIMMGTKKGKALAILGLAVALIWFFRGPLQGLANTRVAGKPVSPYTVLRVGECRDGLPFDTSGTNTDIDNQGYFKLWVSQMGGHLVDVSCWEYLKKGPPFHWDHNPRHGATLVQPIPNAEWILRATGDPTCPAQPYVPKICKTGSF